MFNGGTMWKCPCGRPSHDGPVCPTCLKGVSEVREALAKWLASRGDPDPASLDTLMRHVVDAIEPVGFKNSRPSRC
jgi:hypothetical protein